MPESTSSNNILIGHLLLDLKLIIRSMLNVSTLENEMESNTKITKVLDWQDTELSRARTDVTTYFLNYYVSSFHYLM